MKKEQIKQIKLLSLFLIIGFFTCFFVFASEIDWPVSPMGTALPPEYENTSFSILVKYMYEWGISLGALAAFISIIVAGFNYLTSAGNSSKINEAKKRITASFLGIALLLGTFLILNTINPEITSLEIKTNISEPDSLKNMEFVDYKFVTKCAYAKLYTTSDEMKEDEDLDFPKDGGKGYTMTLDKCFDRTYPIYAVQLISELTVKKIITKFDNNGQALPTTTVDVEPSSKDYPETAESLLLDKENSYVKSMGTECKLYLYGLGKCSELNLFGISNITYPTNDLASASLIDPEGTYSYKLVNNK
ncbi:MAG: pilin [Candidatus Paceibacterota bacterium]